MALGNKKWTTLGVVMVAAALALSGCSGSGAGSASGTSAGGSSASNSTSSSSSGGGATGSGSSGSLPSIRVVVGVNSLFAPVWVGIKEGFFKDAGVNVINGGTGGARSAAAAAALVVSGKYDMALSSVANLAQASAQGINLVVVAGDNSTGGPGNTDMEVVGPKTITSLAGLAKKGTILGVNGLKSPSQLATMNAIEKAGGNPSLVEFKNVPYVSAAGLVANGSVTAVTTIQPFTGAAVQKNPKLHVIGSASAALEAHTPGLSFVTTPAFAKKNAKALKAFRAGLKKTDAWLHNKANFDAYVSIVAANTSEKPETIRKTPMANFEAGIYKQPTLDYLKLYVKYGFLKEVPAFNKLVTPGAVVQ